MILTDPRERTRFIRFTIVGTIGAGVDFGTFNLLVSVGHLHPVLASVCSFIAAVTSNFVWNRFWTYPDSRTKPVFRQVAEFALVNLIGLSIRTPIFTFLESRLGYWLAPYPLPLGAVFWGHNLALAVAVVVVLFWNFYVNRYWTYGDVDAQ